MSMSMSTSISMFIDILLSAFRAGEDDVCVQHDVHAHVQINVHTDTHPIQLINDACVRKT